MADDTLTVETFQAISAAAKRIKNPVRQAWIFNSTYVDSKGVPTTPIQMSVNPSSATFTQSKRISTARKTIGGTTYFKWADKKGRAVDNLIINFAGETGPVSGLGRTKTQQDETTIITVDGAVQPRALKNGQNWARLYTLTAQPDINPLTFVPTVWTIRYKSLILPDVVFSGFFNSILQFSDEAASPLSKRYTMGFTVLAMSPDIFELRNLIGEINVDIDAKSSIVTTGDPAPIGNLA